MENIMSSKLFTTRQGTVLLGVIAAVIAAVALLVYLNHYRNSVSTPPVSVLVANRLIQQGMSGKAIANSGGNGSGSYYVLKQFPKSSVETGAIVNPATLTDQVALHDISFGQQLTAADFGPSSSSSLPDQLAPNQRAVVVSLGSPQAVGGQITAGSHVDVWVTLNGQTNGVNRPIVRLLYQDVYVLNAGTNGGNVTLRATSKQAGKLIDAAQNSQIWLTLRPTVASNIKPPVLSSGALNGG